MYPNVTNLIKPIDEVNPMWDTLTADERMYLRENTRLQHYNKNAVIYAVGETPRFMICLINGRVKEFREGLSNRCQIVRFVRISENFGYAAGFAQTPYQTTAVAMEHSDVYLVPLSIIRQMIQSNNKLAAFFIHDMAVHVCNMDMRITSLTQKHIRGRLAESLLILRNTYGIDIDGKINIRLSRSDLANYANMTTSNAIRTLSSFVEENLIEVRGRYITIIDEVALQKISNIG